MGEKKKVGEKSPVSLQGVLTRAEAEEELAGVSAGSLLELGRNPRMYPVGERIWYEAAPPVT
ncbi:MAG: hypothetical protein FRX49_03168 [Trebouxia sp. A1-2]|nr:MAG: hypothetical protein FRX49_03168 [Trebouxia sp. A1-2]